MRAVVIASACMMFTISAACSAQMQPRPQQAPVVPPVKRADASGRRDQLAEVNQKLADPDPDVRTSYMESVIASGDTTLIQKAISVAMRSDDAPLHNLALRAFMASIHEIIFTVVFPDKLKARMDEAAMDAEAQKALYQSMPWLGDVVYNGARADIGIFKYSFAGNTGGWSWNSNHNDWGHWAGADGIFTISGDRLSGSIVWANKNCAISVRASSDLTLRGTMLCTGGLPALQIAAPIQ